MGCDSHIAPAQAATQPELSLCNKASGYFFLPFFAAFFAGAFFFAVAIVTSSLVEGLPKPHG